MRTRRPAARSQPGSTRRGSVRFGSARRGSPRLSHRTGGPLGLCRVGPGRRWAAGSGAAACCVRKLSWCRRTASGFIFQECESFPLASRRELKFNSGGAAPPNPRPGPSFASRTPRPWDLCPWVPLPGNHGSVTDRACLCVLSPVGPFASCLSVLLLVCCNHQCVAFTQHPYIHAFARRSHCLWFSIHPWVPSLVDPLVYGFSCSWFAFTLGSCCPWVTFTHRSHCPWVALAHRSSYPWIQSP